MQSDYVKKIKLIIPYFLLVSLLSLAIPLTLRWLCEFGLGVDLLALEIWEIWIPLGLSFVFIFLLLRPKLALLKFKNDKGRGLSQILAWIFISNSGVFLQLSFTTNTHDLVPVVSVSDLATSKHSRYYSIDYFSIRGKEAGNHVDVRRSIEGRDLEFRMYTVAPFAVPEYPNGEPAIWMAVLQHQTVSNRLALEEKERLYKQFLENAWRTLQRYDFDAITYFEKVSRSENMEHFESAVASSLGKAPTGDLVLLMPSFGHFEDRKGSEILWAVCIYGIGLLVYVFSLRFPSLQTRSEKTIRKRLYQPYKDLHVMLTPTRQVFVTPLLVNINLLVFIVVWLSGVSAINPNGIELMEWGANRRTETMSGEWWRLVTSMFLHGGIMHLLMNMYGLFIAAIYVQPIMGNFRMGLVYFISGLCGSLASIYWYENTVSVGASGAIFGLFGAILVLLPTRIFERSARKPVLIMFGSYIGISLLMGLAGGIDNAAHLGGLLAGALTSIVLYFSTLRQHLSKR